MVEFSSIPERVLERAAQRYVEDADTGCWDTEYRNSNSLGQAMVGWWTGREKLAAPAHRLAWMYTHGPIPPAAVVRQSCENIRCVFPGHLQLLSRDENIARRTGYTDTCSRPGCDGSALTKDGGRRGLCAPHYRDYRTDNHTCKYDGCKRYREKAGYCGTHYAKVTNRICINEGCEKPTSSSALKCGSCQWREKLAAGAPCALKGCPFPMVARDMCNKHYRRFLEHGDPLAGATFHGSSEIGQCAAHNRVTRLWGKAAQYDCIECGAQAKDWAYDGTDPTQKYGPQISNGVAKNFCYYSLYPEFYMPMCRKCHRRRDSELQVAELREYRQWKTATGMTLADVAIVPMFSINLLEAI